MPFRSLSKKFGASLLIALFLLSTLLLHYIWEIGQVRFFESLRDVPFTIYAVHCFVASLGDVFNIDPTFLRISFVLAFFFISWEVAVVAYVAAGIYLHLKKNKALPSDDRRSDFDRMDDVGKGRTSIHDLRTTLDARDRRMMAIDHHLNRQNDDLAREIEALRGDTK